MYYLANVSCSGLRVSAKCLHCIVIVMVGTPQNHLGTPAGAPGPQVENHLLIQNNNNNNNDDNNNKSDSITPARLRKISFIGRLYKQTETQTLSFENNVKILINTFFFSSVLFLCFFFLKGAFLYINRALAFNNSSCKKKEKKKKIEITNGIEIIQEAKES